MCYTFFRSINNISSIKIDVIIIKQVKSAKDFSVILDDHLNWQEHTKDLSKIGHSYKIIKHQTVAQFGCNVSYTGKSSDLSDLSLIPHL